MLTAWALPELTNPTGIATKLTAQSEQNRQATLGPDLVRACVIGDYPQSTA
jgi:hypothetical protein